MTLKRRRCKQCKEIFQQVRPLQYICGYTCAGIYAKKLEEKKERKETAEKKKELLTHKDWIQIAQALFNTTVRLRDKGRECISCPTILTGKFDAGHLYSVGGNPGLRFDYDNTHGQCVHCNQHKHGNLLEYSERLPKRIGIERFEALKERKNLVVKLTIPEIQEKIKHYKFLIKAHR